MIERYTLFDIGQLSDRYALPGGLPKGIKPSHNRKPGVLQPIIYEREGQRIAERMLWGFLPDHAKNTNSIFRFKTFGVKSEAIFSKPSTATAIRTQRCLVPVNGFYVWHKTAEDTKAFYVTRRDKQLFSLAGVYSSWKRPDDTIEPTFSIVSCEANDDLHTITNRMPVLIHPDDESTWLSADTYDATPLYDIMRPCPNGVLVATAVNASVVSAKKDTPELIRPLEK